MSEGKSQDTPQVDSTIECAMCGRVGGPLVSCSMCQGNPRLTRKRQFTLTEERQGQHDQRSGHDAPVGPERLTTDVVLPKHD